jgi:cation diffusion facilitator family transporter
MDARLHKRALRLSYFTVGYNVLEGVVSIGAGMWAGSVALVAFGLDSFVESFSGGVMIWRFSAHEKMTEEDEERAEKKATRLVGYTFFVFAAYVLYESVDKLYMHEAPEPTILGIIIAAVSLVVMPVLYYMKRETAEAVGSRSLAADSMQTLACTFLSLSLLVGLGLNYLFALWQADPVVGLVIVAFLVREGYRALTQEELCSC